MTILPSITEFISQLELFSNGKLNYPEKIRELLQIAMQTGLTQEFEELVFQAKFLMNTREVMKKNRPGGEGFEKLSAEFESSQHRSMALLKNLVERAAPELSGHYSEFFFSLDAESFIRLMNLYSDLRWIKNWQIDGKPLPFQPVRIIPADRPAISHLPDGNNRLKADLISFRHLRQIAILALLFFMIFLLIDPPVTILGWILSVGIMVMLVYITIQLVIFIRKYSVSDCP